MNIFVEPVSQLFLSSPQIKGLLRLCILSILEKHPR